MEIYFEVKYLDQATEFFRSINRKAAKNLLFNISKAQQVRDQTIFKKLAGTDIWEFRAMAEGMQYRLFAFWVKEDNVLVICTHGIVKKRQKTPIKEIEKAEKLRRKYLEL
jgi:phage-related protein